MLKRVVIGATLACLVGTPVFAVEGEPAAEDECMRQLAQAEEALQTKFEANAISEQDFDRANDLLDQADELCTEGNLEEATEKLAGVNRIVAKGE